MPVHPFCRKSRDPGSRGWTPGRPGSLSQHPGWASEVTLSLPRMTPFGEDSFQRHPKPGEAPTSRAWGRASRCNDRAHGLWVAAAEEAGGIRLFLAEARPLARAGVGGAAGPPSALPDPQEGAGRGAGWRARGAGRFPRPTSGLLPPESLRVPPPHSARTRGRRRSRRARVSRGAPSRCAARRAWTRAGTS